jgi:hypothetical protein
MWLEDRGTTVSGYHVGRRVWQSKSAHFMAERVREIEIGTRYTPQRHALNVCLTSSYLSPPFTVLSPPRSLFNYKFINGFTH